MSDENIVKASDVQLSTLSIISPSGTSISLTHVMTELNIFEDIFSSTMSGNIVVNDSLNIINKLPIVGTEYLLISFEKPGSSVSITKVFKIYKITDRSRTNQQNETYIIHFASEELIMSETVLVSKTFHNKSISDIVQSIATDYLRISKKKFPTNAIEPSQGTSQVIIPNWSPLFAINWLAKRAISKHTGASYVWYEDRDGFHFTSIEKLMESPPLRTLRVSPKNSSDTGDELQISQDGLENYIFNEMFDTLRNIKLGMYAGQLVTVDPIRRRIQTVVVKSPAFYETTQHSEKNQFLLPNKDRMGMTLVDHTESNHKVYTTVSDSADSTYSRSKTQQRPNNVERWMLQRDMYLANLHAIRLTGVLPGSLNLRVGNMVELILPASEGQEKGGRIIDEIYSGKYLVTALRHKINKTSHACIVEFSKDAVRTKLPEPQALNSVEQIKGM